MKPVNAARTSTVPHASSLCLLFLMPQSACCPHCSFCHWPQPAYFKADGTWVPSQTNFTSLATPTQIGSGRTALVTLLHEGGHAAHFANVLQRSPFFRSAVLAMDAPGSPAGCAGAHVPATALTACFGWASSGPCSCRLPMRSQERAPTSVAYAETQSMTLDSLAGDAAWLGRYARNRCGASLPAHVGHACSASCPAHCALHTLPPATGRARPASPGTAARARCCRGPSSRRSCAPRSPTRSSCEPGCTANTCEAPCTAAQRDDLSEPARS